MLKHRLFFGTLMSVLFLAIVIIDGWWDGSITKSAPDKAVQGTIFVILVALLAIPAQLEMSMLAATKKLKIFVPVSIVASILFASFSYWIKFIEIAPDILLLLLSSLTIFTVFLYQYLNYGTSSVMANIGVNCLAIWYLGLLSGFCVAIRIDYGLWYLLMFVFVVKSADIGAYTVGSMFGKHKFSPRISPKKTWEGMAGAVGLSIIVAIGFARFCGIMPLPLAVVFGLCFAFIGQLGDLAESMLKRDAEQKDSASKVPGFGGVLDIIDSLLISAPLAYVFYMCVS